MDNNFQVLWYLRNPSFFPWRLIEIDAPVYGPAHVCVIKILKKIEEFRQPLSGISPNIALFELKSKEFEDETQRIVDLILRWFLDRGEVYGRTKEEEVMKCLELEFWTPFSTFMWGTIEKAIADKKYSHPKEFKKIYL
jgi:hypothetical protein